MSSARASTRRSLTVAIEPGLAAAIDAVVDRHDTTLSTFLLACWQTLLWRVTNHPNICVGVTCDGRTYEELQTALGAFARCLPIGGRFEGSLRFDRLLARVDSVSREMLEWQQYGYGENLGESSDVAEPLSFAAAFEFNQPAEKFSFADITLSQSRLYSCTDRFRVKLSCLKSKDFFSADLLYDLNSFSRSDIERMAAQFRALLQSVVSNPAAAIGELEILSPAERLNSCWSSSTIPGRAFH